MVTYYLIENLQGEYQIVGYGDEGQVSCDTYFHLYIARQHLSALEDDGNVCIDTLMVGY